jgi:hypothetical protein
MNRRLASLLALALPLVGLTGMWASTEHWHRQGTDWLVPVEGYDPRDLLRGHYVQFRYAWPGAEEAPFDPAATAEPDSYPLGACITGTAPAITRVVKLESEAARAACQHRLAPDGTTIFGTPDLPRDGRLYVAQTAGKRLEEQLRDPAQQGMIRMRLRSDGTVTPLELTFRPRPPAAAAGADTPAR